ncbi:CBS domain-containing protein [Streptomyces sp. KD18]|nr:MULTISPECIES: CBS domain-containing protein [Streptomyces]MBD3574975.1 CBS domain-containing protein [Streptomyces sp. KD18]
MQPRTSDTGSNRSHPTVRDAMEATGPQVCDDMTVEVALAVMAGARAGHLLVSDEHGLCTGLVTRAGLTAIRDSAAYTDRARLRDVLGGHGPVTSPLTAVAEAERAMRHRRLDLLPVVDEEGSAVGVLDLAR